MTDKSLIYTITSTNPNSYNVIRTNLQVPFGDFCRLTVTNLTTKATFILLNKHDYIVIESINDQSEAHDTKYNFTDNYGELTNEGFGALLDDLLESEGINASIDNVGRLILNSTKSFTITEMSYNVKMISGFYNDKFPLVSEMKDDKYKIAASSVGYSLSTPILYLVSNLGAKCYDNIDELYCDRKVLMRVSNSFTAGYPIINSNAEFTSIVPVNSLSNIEFRLVDANMHDVQLLTPMYLSVQTDSIETEDESKITVQNQQTESQNDN